MSAPQPPRDDLADQRRRAERASRADALDAPACAALAAGMGEDFKDELYRAAVHELRNALSVVQGWAQVLGLAGRKPEVVAEAAEVLQRSVRDQEELLGAIHDIGERAADDAAPARIPIDLGGAIASARESVGRFALARSVEVRVVIDPEARSALGDPIHLHFVIRHLLLGAIQASPERGLVLVEVISSEQSARLLVTDEGDRLSEGSPPCPFERLRRSADGSPGRESSLDFFLATIRLRIERLGGRVAAWSPEAGVGATFAVLLPKPGRIRFSEDKEDECADPPLDRRRPEELSA
jgi:signal transduction histidine kinase